MLPQSGNGTNLNAADLEQVKVLITDPLAQTVRAEMQAYNNSVSGAIENLTSKLADHIANATTTSLENKSDIEKIEQRVTALEQLAWKGIGAGVILSAILSGLWVGVVEFAKYVFKH